jgi:hypothetical protein
MLMGDSSQRYRSQDEELVNEYVRKKFPSHSLLDYALTVEKGTTAKKDTVSHHRLSP